MTQTTWFRIGIAVIYLVSILLLSGFFAERFGYPSLWGNSNSVFNEYSSILPFGWSLAHYLTLIPLTLLMAGLPTWNREFLVKFRWFLLGAFTLCFVGTLVYGNGRWHQVPFTLFYMVDFATFFLFSLFFHPPWRAIFGTSAVGAIVALAAVLIPIAFDRFAEENPQTAAQDEPPAPKPLLEPAGSVLDRTRMVARYDIYVNRTVYDRATRLNEEICYTSESVFLQMELKEPAPEGFTSEVQFMAHPEFEPRENIVWPYGGAGYVDGEWQCWIEYPSPPAQTSEDSSLSD